MKVMSEPKRRKPAREPSLVNWSRKLLDLRQFYHDTEGNPLPQEEAAALAHTTLGAWRNWEQGRRQPSRAIVRLLHLTFPEFFSQNP